MTQATGQINGVFWVQFFNSMFPIIFKCCYVFPIFQFTETTTEFIMGIFPSAFAFFKLVMCGGSDEPIFDSVMGNTKAFRQGKIHFDAWCAGLGMPNGFGGFNYELDKKLLYFVNCSFHREFRYLPACRINFWLAIVESHGEKISK